MIPAPIGANEAERLAALLRYQILDTAAEAEFDDFTRLAAHICGVSIALISLVDSGRQWFKSKVGLDAEQTARDISFCGHAIHGQGLFEIPNALEDERFRDNPLVTAPPAIRFYAGAPLITPDGYGIGTLCVIDSLPRTLTPQQRDALMTLAHQVVQQMELGMTARRERRLNEELSRQMSFQQALLDSAAIAVISTTVEGIITSFNPAASALLGYSAAELIGKQTPGLFHDAVEVVARAKELTDELGHLVEPGFEVFVAKPRVGSAETREWSYICKGGRRVPVQLTVSSMRDEHGAAIGYLGLARDISAQKAAEQSIREFKSTLDQTLDCVFMFDAETLRFFYANQGALNQVGYSFDELLQMHPYDVKPDITTAQFMELIAPLLARQQSAITFETVHQHKSGKRVPVEIFLQYIAPPGERPRFVAIVRDISERQRVERMKREFVSIVSHELRTPLAAISGALGLIVGGAFGEMPQQIGEMLRIAHSNSQRLTHLINDLLDMEKLVAGKMVFDMRVEPLKPLLWHTIEINRAYSDQYRVRFELEMEGDELSVCVDGARLQQVITNLLSNAAKFSPQNGVVTVRAHRQGEMVRVDVIDHGPGIPEEFRSRIFQKFSQADSSDSRLKGGTGLGLAICRELIERMHGTIGFESEPGQGASFYFELPLVQNS